AGGSVKNAVNMPLDDVANLAAKQLPDRNQPILVYCLSGTRSAMAKTILARSGYTNVHNLGSFMRARSIAG
ncbi:MAG: rhodanese-like domain-containing protein, partial [Candidatus Riflebacteria bacterium]